jgi:hypothetical protein
MSELLLCGPVHNFFKFHKLKIVDMYDQPQSNYTLVNIALQPWNAVYVQKNYINRHGVVTRIPAKLVFDTDEDKTLFLLKWT